MVSAVLIDGERMESWPVYLAVQVVDRCRHAGVEACKQGAVAGTPGVSLPVVPPAVLDLGILAGGADAYWFFIEMRCSEGIAAVGGVRHPVKAKEVILTAVA